MTVEEVLEKVQADFMQVDTDIKALLTSGADLLWKPSADKWNAAQCIDHIIVTNESYFLAIEKRLTTLAGKEKNQQVYKPTFWGKIIRATVDPDTKGKRKTKSPKIFKPAAEVDINTLLQRFTESQNQFLVYLQKMKETDANKKIASPISPLVLLSLADAVDIILQHEKYHYLQALIVLGEKV